MSYFSWSKRPPRMFRGKPQWTLGELYISPFTARRRFDEEGVMQYDPVERNLKPTGVEVMDHYLRRLTEGKDEVTGMGYPNKKPRKSYMSFSLEPLDMNLTFLVEHHLIERIIELDANHAKGTPIFIEP